MKWLFLLCVCVPMTALVFASVPACSSGPSNEEACSKFDSLCNGGSSGDGGVTITVTCKPDQFDNIDNDTEVKECIESSSDCNAAIACLQKAKPK